MSVRVLERLQATFGDAILETHSQHGDDTAVVDAKMWRDIAAFCRADSALDFNMMTDLTAVDYPAREEGRLEVVMHLYSINKRHRVRLKARIGDQELDVNPEISTVANVWPGANWLEREVFDMFGVNFTGHPDLRRILMYPEFTGHPLRKDYPANKTQPLIEFRTEEEAGLPLNKLAPFLDDEGMSFGRNANAPPTPDEAS